MTPENTAIFSSSAIIMGAICFASAFMVIANLALIVVARRMMRQ